MFIFLFMDDAGNTMFFDEEEKLKKTMHKEIQTNMQNLTLTIDINIVVKGLTVIMVLVIVLVMIIYEFKYLIKQNKQFKSFYETNIDFTSEEIVS